MFRRERKRIMVYRALPLCLVALAVALFIGSPVLAEKNKEAEQGDQHEGTVVSVSKDSLTMKGKTKEHTHKVAANVKVTCDSKACKLEDLKPGQKVRVTTKKGDRETVLKVESLNKNEKFDKGAGKDTEKKSADKNQG